MSPPKRKSPVVPPRQRLFNVSVEAVYFRRDHVADGQQDVKLLRPSAGDMAETSDFFQKPEWEVGKKEHAPTSYSMGTKVTVDLRFDVSKIPAGRTLQVTRLRGTSSPPRDHFTFDLTRPETLSQDKPFVWWIEANAPLPLDIREYMVSITWSATIDGKEVALGTTDQLELFVLFDRPHGKIERSSPDAMPTTTGSEQQITVERLHAAITLFRSGSVPLTDEASLVEDVFTGLSGFQRYDASSEWPSLAFKNLSFHQYLWQLADAQRQPRQRGACNMLASSFILVCQSLGVKGTLSIGRMYPSGSRENSGKYPKRSNPVRGKYNVPEVRSHGSIHGDESLIFIDKNGIANNFEAVANYMDRQLYPIGEPVKPSGTTLDEMVHHWFESADFSLCFLRMAKPHYRCDDAYPGVVDKDEFKWYE